MLGKKSLFFKTSSCRIFCHLCAGHNLTYLPTFTNKPWVRSLDLEGNLLRSVNFTLLLTRFPNLRLVDLRRNPGYICGVPPSDVKVLADCKIHVKSTAATSTVLSTFSIAPYFSSPSSSTSASASASETLILLLSCGVSLLGLLFIVLWVICRRRRRFRTVQPASSLSIASSSSNETIYESAV